MTGSFGQKMGELCGARSAPTVVTKTLRNNALVATRIIVDEPGTEKTDPTGVEEALIAAITFQEGYYRDNWLDDVALPAQPPQPAGSLSLMDLRRGNRTRFKSPVNSVQFYFPRSTLNAIANANELSYGDELTSPLGVLFGEPTFAQLGASLIPAFERPGEISQLFLDHVLTASAIHLLVDHGSAVKSKKPMRGGLAPWQQRRVLELLEQDLAGNVSVADLASLCNLSPRHFARAFSESNGMPPHRWILQKRIEKSKELLAHSTMSLDEIARNSSFASQSHFTRVFTQQVGQSPGAWRRIRRD